MSIKRCSEIAAASSWLWWPSTAVIPVTSSRTGSERCATSSVRCAGARRGRRSTL
jgi:hypothetical protein